jgi:hypothetical protein
MKNRKSFRAFKDNENFLKNGGPERQIKMANKESFFKTLKPHCQERNI